MEEGYGVYGSDEEDDVGIDGEAEDEEDSSEDEEDLMTAEELEEYQKKVIEAPYNYEAHIQLISALRLMGQIEPLRAAREKMSSLFPLPQEEWEQWIQDEQGLATSRFGQEQVIGLFERALADYQSVKLWEEYGRYVAQLPDTNPERVRQVFEEGLTRVGLHIPLAHQLWKAYRDYETSQDQPSRVRKLYHRELAVPLMDMEEVMEEYKQWESEQVDQEPDAGKEKQLQQAYERALRLLKERLPYEQSIAGSEQTSASEPDYSKLEMWKTYLQFEEAQKNPSQVQCLYERAVKSYCLVEELWFNYATYLERELKNVHDVTILVYERAVRNCPWSGSLWPAYIRALERGNRADSQVRAVFEKALQAGGGSLSAEGYLAIYEAFIDYCYRQLRGSSERKESSAEKGKEVAISSDSSLQQQELLRLTFQRAVDFFKSYYTESGYATKLQRYWGTIEARQLGNPEKGVELWEDLVKEHGKQGEIWLEYISLIRSVASHDWMDKCRSSFKRACNCVHDWPEKVFSSWLDFEREYGSLEDWQQAYVRCSKRGVEIAKIRQKEAELYAQGQAYGDQQQQNYYVPPQAQRRRRQDGRSAMVPKQRKAVRRTNQQSNNGARGEKRKRWEREEAAEGEEQKQRQPQEETVPDDHTTKRDFKKPKKSTSHSFFFNSL
ncbi:Splicing factor [Balamuthia mandrillaris]